MTYVQGEDLGYVIAREGPLPLERAFAIFKRLWKYKSDQPQRDDHLDLFAQEIRELRETVQRLK